MRKQSLGLKIKNLNMSPTHLKNIFQKYFKLSESSYELDDNQSSSGDFNNPEIEKFALEFKDIGGAKNDDAFKIELNKSISIKQVKIETYLHLLKLIKELILLSYVNQFLYKSKRSVILILKVLQWHNIGAF
jgi:hypothetical protein